MRIELLNVECEFQVPVVFGRRNVYVTTVDTAASTSDMNNIAFRLYANWGLPKSECSNELCEMPLRVINSKPSKGKGDDAEYPIRQRSSHSSLVGSNDSHGIYPVFQTKENSYCIPKLKFD